MSSLEEKKTELERVLEVFQNYIERSKLLDVANFYANRQSLFFGLTLKICHCTMVQEVNC